MFRKFRIGTLLGFPVDVNLSFLLLLGVALLFWGGLAGVGFVLMAFASVLVHELGHALVARHLGVAIAGIELHFFGGAAKMTGQPKNAGDEITIAAAGPAVSFLVGGMSVLLALVSGVGVFEKLGWINFLIGGFNLLPALPLDGGRIFRALLARKRGFVPATELAIKVARVIAVGLGALALASGSFYLVLLAVLIWSMGSQELRAARLGYHGGYRVDVPPFTRSGYRMPTAEVIPASFEVRRVYTGSPRRGGHWVRQSGRQIIDIED